MMDMIMIDSLDKLVEYFFTMLRGISERGGEPPRVIRENCEGMLHQIVEQILLSEETPKRKVVLINRINARFMSVLLDYDRPWVWQLLRSFSADCPPQHLN